MVSKTIIEVVIAITIIVSVLGYFALSTEQQEDIVTQEPVGCPSGQMEWGYNNKCIPTYAERLHYKNYGGFNFTVISEHEGIVSKKSNNSDNTDNVISFAETDYKISNLSLDKFKTIEAGSVVKLNKVNYTPLDCKIAYLQLLNNTSYYSNLYYSADDNVTTTYTWSNGTTHEVAKTTLSKGQIMTDDEMVSLKDIFWKFGIGERYGFYQYLGDDSCKKESDYMVVSVDNNPNIDTIIEKANFDIIIKDSVVYIPMSIMDMIEFLKANPQISNDDADVLLSFAVGKQYRMTDPDVDAEARRIMEKLQ